MSAAHQRLIAAAETVLAGLNARIDRCARSRVPVPVFEGIAELCGALNSLKAADDVAAEQNSHLHDAERIPDSRRHEGDAT